MLLELVLSVLLLNYFGFYSEVKFVLNDGNLETCVSGPKSTSCQQLLSCL